MQINLDRDELAAAATAWVFDRLHQDEGGDVIEVEMTIHSSGQGATAKVTFSPPGIPTVTLPTVADAKAKAKDKTEAGK